MLTQEQSDFLEILKAKLGIVTEACTESGIDIEQYNTFMLEPDFVTEAAKIEEICLDFVETKLLKLIDNENIAAISFYLKEKGYKRGYGQKKETKKNGNNARSTGW